MRSMYISGISIDNCHTHSYISKWGTLYYTYYVSYIVSLIVDFGQMNARWRCHQAWRSWEDHSLGSRWLRLAIERAGLACWERRLTLPFPAVLLHPKLQQTQRTLWQQHQRQNSLKPFLCWASNTGNSSCPVLEKVGGLNQCFQPFWPKKMEVWWPWSNDVWWWPARSNLTNIEKKSFDTFQTS